MIYIYIYMLLYIYIWRLLKAGTAVGRRSLELPHVPGLSTEKEATVIQEVRFCSP